MFEKLCLFFSEVIPLCSILICNLFQSPEMNTSTLSYFGLVVPKLTWVSKCLQPLTGSARLHYHLESHDLTRWNIVYEVIKVIMRFGC